MKIIDGFLFNDELDMLECRLRELDEVVDLFVLCEATHTFQGDPKPLHYLENQDRFAPWADRIHHVTAELPDGHGTWARENAQRDELGKTLGFMNDTDVFMLSDVDEIPYASTVEQFRRLHGPLTVYERFYCFAVDWQHPARFWRGTIACPGHALKPLSLLRYDKETLATVMGGWHFTWVGDWETKLHSFSHTEIIEEATDFGLERYYTEGVHVDGQKLKPVTVDNTWPVWIADKQCPAGWFRP